MSLRTLRYVLIICAYTGLAVFVTAQIRYQKVQSPFYGFGTEDVVTYRCRKGSDHQAYVARVHAANRFFQTEINASLKDMAFQIADAIKNKSGQDAIMQIETADIVARAEHEQITSRLKQDYGCKLISIE